MAILIRAIELIVILLMGVVVGVVITETAMRGLFDTSLIITDELSRYLMIWIALLAAALLVHEDGHIRITLLSGALQGRLGLMLYVIAQLVLAAFMVLVIVASLMIMPSLAQQNTVTLGFSIVWIYAALPLSGALMLFFSLRNLVLRARRMPTGDAEV